MSTQIIITQNDIVASVASKKLKPLMEALASTNKKIDDNSNELEQLYETRSKELKERLLIYHKGAIEFFEIDEPDCSFDFETDVSPANMRLNMDFADRNMKSDITFELPSEEEPVGLNTTIKNLEYKCDKLEEDLFDIKAKIEEIHNLSKDVRQLMVYNLMVENHPSVLKTVEGMFESQTENDMK